jgi:2-dehydro-3-deoxy-D-arabinonate dehydratase
MKPSAITNRAASASRRAPTHADAVACSGDQGPAVTLGLWRVDVEGQVRLARGPSNRGPAELLDIDGDVDQFLTLDGPDISVIADVPSPGPVPGAAQVLRPIGAQEVWASGVTFERSLQERNLEAPGVAYYDNIFDSERPELFFKSTAGRVRASGEPICIRMDSEWNVPEPEIGLVADASGQIVAYTLGNDVSSRSIEAENPLYLPQAKVYEGSCSLGPCLVPAAFVPFDELTIELAVRRAGASVYHDAVPMSRMKRDPKDLVDWLMRALVCPAGVVLLSGTSIVPPPDFTLQAGDEVTISAPHLGTLNNRVQVLDLHDAALHTAGREQQ